tara:strand:- start:2131 stop:3036 length:906 start_codon:yes stop_codon:yes gene_type:complete
MCTKIKIGCLKSSWILVSDEDAADYLQSQFSNDLRGLEPGSFAYGFWLSRKGKVEADSYVFKQADGFILYSPHCEEAPLIEKLEANIIADEVVLEGTADTLACLTLIGKDYPNFLEKLNLKAPQGNQVITQGGYTALSIPRSKEPSCELLFPKAQRPAIEALLKDFPHQELSDTALEDERITSLIPKIPQDIGPNDFPQEAGLDTGNVSYNKGCYLGQEVMQRLHNIGGLQRKLFALKLESPAPALPAPLYKGEKQVGELRSQSSDHKIGLGLIKYKLVEAQDTLSFTPSSTPHVQLQASL